VCFSLFGEDKIAMLEGLQPGSEIEVSFNLSSREYNGKYYHNIDAWRINRAAAAVVEDMPQAPLESLEAEDDDDLPF